MIKYAPIRTHLATTDWNAFKNLELATLPTIIDEWLWDGSGKVFYNLFTDTQMSTSTVHSNFSLSN